MAKTTMLNLLPAPRSLKLGAGVFLLPRHRPLSAIQVEQTDAGPAQPEGYAVTIDGTGVRIEFRESGGLRAATATLRQLLRAHGRRLPFLKIRDWPDFARRGVMLDISRGRVPTLATLLNLAEHLADFKINELQLYTEHTFAYLKYPEVWRSWGALTGKEIEVLDRRCRELGIDLVPNQNSFGHLRYFLEDPKLKKLAEIAQPYEDPSGEFVRHPTTLAPNHPGTLPFLRGLYDELLPNFSSAFFNIGADETWDLGRGQSQKLCARQGQGRVYLEFLKKLHREVSRRGKQMMFWGDIILKYPALIRELPRPVIALNWGYEANHPFAAEAAKFAKAKIPFYVCPGTSTWQTMIGKHDNALTNLTAAARAGKKFGAIGFLNTDWGDGGHPQPLAVSWPLYLAGAALAWNADGFDREKLAPVLSRDVFVDPSGNLATAAIGFGFAHQKLGVSALNETPLGSVVAAPTPGSRELFCRNGLKWHARIPAKNVEAAHREIERQRKILSRAKPQSDVGKLLGQELDLAARMAAESCHYMQWQQAVAAGKKAEAARMARRGIQALQHLDRDFETYWPRRNKATPKHCSPFLLWRVREYQVAH
jgi:hypothetical protein